MVFKENSKSSLVQDAAFKTPQSCREFFKTKGRSRATPVDDVIIISNLCFLINFNFLG